MAGFGAVDAIDVVQVDERSSSWEEGRPLFRVYLHGSGQTSTHGWTDTYDIKGADVLQVIDWAQRQAGDRLTYAIALVYDDEHLAQLNPGHGRGLVWLVGRDGNDVDSDGSEPAAQQRMLARRVSPVKVPEFDEMPAGVADPYSDGSAHVCVQPNE